MKFDAFSLVVLLGALQALFFSIYLFFSPAENSIRKRTLAFFIFILSYNGFETLNWSSELYKYLFIFDLFPFVLVFGLGPCIYLYVRSFRASITMHRIWPYFSFIGIFFILRLSIFLTWILQVNLKKVFVDVNRLDFWYGAIAEPMSVLVFTSFWFISVKEYRLMNLENTENGTWTEEEKKVITRWLKTLLVVMGVFSLLWICTVGLPFIYNIGDEKYYVIEIALVVFIYWIGYAGYHRSRIIYITQQKKTQSYFDNLTAEEIKHCIDVLEKKMETNKLYLDPDLSLNSLALQIGVQPKMLSAVLNQVLQKGFSEYINTWRVEAVKQMILDPEKRHMTITGIAYDCGFNSQPTFQRAFKAVTGQTPRDYIQNSIQIQN